MLQQALPRYRVRSLIFVDDSQLGPCACSEHDILRKCSHHANSTGTKTSNQFSACGIMLKPQGNGKQFGFPERVRREDVNHFNVIKANSNFLECCGKSFLQGEKLNPQNESQTVVDNKPNMNQYQYQESLANYKIHASSSENALSRPSTSSGVWGPVAGPSTHVAAAHPTPHKTALHFPASDENSGSGEIYFNQEMALQGHRTDSSAGDCLRIPPNYFDKRDSGQHSGAMGHFYSNNHGYQKPEMGYLRPVSEREKWFEDIDLSLCANFFYSSSEAASASCSSEPWPRQTTHWGNLPSSSPASLSTLCSESPANFVTETSNDLDSTLSKPKKTLLPSPDIGLIQNSRPGNRFGLEHHKSSACQTHQANAEYPRSFDSPLSSLSENNDVFKNSYSNVNKVELHRPGYCSVVPFTAKDGARKPHNYAHCVSSRGNGNTMTTCNQGPFVQGTDGNFSAKKALLPNPPGRRTLLPTPAACRPHH